MSIIELVRDIWMSNACVKFEERSLNPSKVIALTKLCGDGGGPRGGCVADENIIFPKTYVSREYNYIVCIAEGAQTILIDSNDTKTHGVHVISQLTPSN